MLTDPVDGLDRNEVDGLVDDWARTARQPPGDALDGYRVRTLGQILEGRGVVSAPDTVVPRLAWLGRVTLLAATEKSGKSTLAAAASAAVSNGNAFLGEPVTAGKVVYIAAEGHEADHARNVASFGANEATVIFAEPLGEDPVNELEPVLIAKAPRLVVIDSLASFVSPLQLDPNRSTD